eukprot:911291-Rhodomonas_salina.1
MVGACFHVVHTICAHLRSSTTIQQFPNTTVRKQIQVSKILGQAGTQTWPLLYVEAEEVEVSPRHCGVALPGPDNSKSVSQEMVTICPKYVVDSGATVPFPGASYGGH